MRLSPSPTSSDLILFLVFLPHAVTAPAAFYMTHWTFITLRYSITDKTTNGKNKQQEYMQN